MAKKHTVTLSEHRGRACTWLHVGEASAHNLRALGERFTFQEHDMRELLPALQHSKCLVRSQYIFLVFLFPVYDPTAKMVRETELDVFLNDKTLVTVNHGNTITEVGAILDDMTNAARRELILSQNPAEVLLNLLDQIYKAAYPLLVKLSRDITAVEDILFKDYERERTIDTVLSLKTDNSRARKAMQNHRNVLLSLKLALPPFFKTPPSATHFDHLLAQTTNIWNTLESQREAIHTLYETNTTLISYRISEIQKTLTIFAVIVFPLTLLAALFGMNTVVSMPFINDPNGFWIIVGLMIVGTLAMLGVFKAKRWI